LHARLYVASGRASDGLKLIKVGIVGVANAHRDDRGVMVCQQRSRCDLALVAFSRHTIGQHYYNAVHHFHTVPGGASTKNIGANELQRFVHQGEAAERHRCKAGIAKHGVRRV
jgi:hypothetical protein